ncbi:MAG: hypothetical protein KJZ78_12985, partial [Bryobacteraceae bacterium]|nr:hypothetical protein [Bryobacteraceae bacterium]
MAFCCNALAQLNQTCTVSVLNRTVQVNPDGSWVLPNVPANIGQVKARATCASGAVTRSGESAFFTIGPNQAVNLPDIVLGAVTLPPESLTITPASPSLTSLGQSLQLTATARYPDSSVKNVTAATTGTSYTTSNAAIASIGTNGLVTATGSGTAVIQAIHDGTPAILAVRVSLTGDSDGDGIPDDVETAQGLDPKNSVDALEDPDRDGLNNRDEIARGTNRLNPDSDGDGLKDGDEVVRGSNPLLADTDGDLIPDGVEVSTGTNPLSRSSYDLRAAAASYQFTPVNFLLSTSSLFPSASQQLTFRVNLIDGKTTLNLTTKSTGTTYSSSNLQICNFGAEDGRVYAGIEGSCVITVTNSTLSVNVLGTVRAFTPGPLSFVTIPGVANNVDVAGNYAYVAAGAAGLVVVDVSDRQSPRIVATLDTPGSAEDVAVSGSYAYVADGPGGVAVVNIAVPDRPILLTQYSFPGAAVDIVVREHLIFSAHGTAGFCVLDHTNKLALPQQAAPCRQVGAGVVGIDYDSSRKIVVLAAGSLGLYVFNVTSLTNPIQVGALPGGNVLDLVLHGNYAFLADFSRSFTAVDLTSPSNPVLRGSTPQATGGLLRDVAVFGTLAFGADEFFVNDVPIIDISNPAAPTPRLLLPFRGYRDDNGTGIAVDAGWVYLTAIAGDSRLYIGQYTLPEDRAGVPPQVTLTSPQNGQTIVQGSTVRLVAAATDDVAVGTVSLLVAGQVVATRTGPPFEANYTFNSLGASNVTAIATDLGGNTGAASINVTVVPDPLTTVTGRVLDESSLPVAGALVTVLGQSTSTQVNGTFSIFGVPTSRGNIIAVATTLAGSGSSVPTPPVPSGTTNVGDIVIRGSSEWTLLLPTGQSPPPMIGPVVEYDPGSNRMMAFGGNV